MSNEQEPSEQDDRSKPELRDQLIEASGELLRGQGIEDFSTTKVADACDTSTQMIYTLFGGKSALLKAVYEAKAEELTEEFQAVEAEDPIERFYEMGMVYRDFILGHAALYDSVFSLEALENYDRADKLIERVDTFQEFENVVEELIETGFLPENTEVAKLTDQLWASMNGILRLTILNFYPDEETALKHYVDTAFDILRGQSDEESPI